MSNESERPKVVDGGRDRSVECSPGPRGNGNCTGEGRTMYQTTERLAHYATALAYGDLTPATIHEVKRKLIDAFGCAVAGYDSEPSLIARRLAAARTATPAARVL